MLIDIFWKFISGHFDDYDLQLIEIQSFNAGL